MDEVITTPPNGEHFVHPFLSGQESLPKKIRHLKTTFRQNGYSNEEIHSALKRSIKNQGATKEEDRPKPIAIANIPFVSTVSGKISRILQKHSIDTVFRPCSKLRDLLVKVKDPCGFETPGVYNIPYECGKVYVGETGRTINTRIKEHKRHLGLCQPEKSAVVEHAIEYDHRVKWDHVKILCRESKFWERLVK